MDKLFSSSLLSGFIIALASFGLASANGSAIGMMLFSFALMSIIFYGLHLFTGDAGFVKDGFDNENLIVTLCGNVIGCVAAGLMLVACGSETVTAFVSNALAARSVNSLQDIWITIAKGIGCGIILTIAVKFAREARDEKNIVKLIPLLLGVPLFLVCGFFHCIVDVFYITYGAVYSEIFLNETIWIQGNLIGWLMVVVGNVIGCNLPRILMLDKDF